MAFLIPPTLGLVGGLLGRFAIKEGLKFGAKQLIKRGAQSALAGTIGNLISKGAGDIGDVLGLGVGSVGTVLGEDIQKSLTQKRKNVNDLTPESFSELGFLNHAMNNRNNNLENVIFGLHPEEFKNINRILSLSPQLQEIQKIRDLNRIGARIS